MGTVKDLICFHIISGSRWSRVSVKLIVTVIVLCMVIAIQSFIAPARAANPFEILSKDHWSYHPVTQLAQKGLFNQRATQRLEEGHQFTMLELSAWMGDALKHIASAVHEDHLDGTDRHGGSAGWSTFDDMIRLYNERGSVSLTPDDAAQFLLLLLFTRDYLMALGYDLPGDVMQIDSAGLFGIGSITLEDDGKFVSQMWETPTESERVIDPGWIANASRESNLATARIFPLLTVEGEVESDEVFQRQSAFKVGALIHPIPELTVGALLYATNREDRFNLMLNEEETRQLDLSAEIGEWILSLRRKHVVRLSDLEDERRAVYTRVGVEHPIGQGILIRAGRETEEEMGDDENEEQSVKTALDFEVTFDRGRFGLGFVLESVPESKQDGNRGMPIMTTASIEHTLGALGVATAGISIGNSGESRTSNVGLRYDFDNTALRLNYEIVSGVEDKREMTTAEVSIKF